MENLMSKSGALHLAFAAFWPRCALRLCFMVFLKNRLAMF
jgi:hypothetical protein